MKLPNCNYILMKKKCFMTIYLDKKFKHCLDDLTLYLKFVGYRHIFFRPFGKKIMIFFTVKNIGNYLIEDIYNDFQFALERISEEKYK